MMTIHEVCTRSFMIENGVLFSVLMQVLTDCQCVCCDMISLIQREKVTSTGAYLRDILHQHVALTHYVPFSGREGG